ncbi:MAG TPA: helix-turn-helix domain-containing protein [Actinomycetota bacterium]|nr:helix-turn-helix domain-containing protein [Actinomycetota bacterium]
MAGTRGDTRARILDTAWGLVQERGIGAVTVADIAAATGVSRQLLYVHFENRAGLLVAMARRHDVRSGFAGRAAGARSLPPVAALERLLRLWFAYVPEILPVARALEAAATNGDEGGVAWRDRMGDLREMFAAAVERVDQDGRLAEGWTVPSATDWVWARAQPATFQHLVVDRAWPADDYTERAVRSILAEVLTPA